ncbi:MAG: hypothetical protein Q8N83_00110 [Ignavibacteria bacterium]|nr:hypothetical protein [Ignavibacteria bacterium]
MTKIITVSFFCLVISLNTFGQRTEFEAPNYQHGLVLENLSSLGFVQNSNYAIENISSSNPASLINFDSASVGISYQSVSMQNPGWLGDIMHKRAYPLLPQSIGAVYPLDNLRIGIGISQRYNSLLDFGEIPVTTIENPYGTGETFTATDETLVIGFSNLYSYSFPSLFYKNDLLSLGLQFNLDRMDYLAKIWDAEGKAGGFKTSFSVGFLYKFEKRLHPGLFEIGFFFEKGSSFKEELKENNTRNLVLADLDTNNAHRQNNYYPVTKLFDIIVKTPDKLNYGFIYSPESLLHFSLNSRTVFWNKVRSGWKNCSEFSCSVIFDYSKTARFSFGLFSSNPQIEDNRFNSQEINENMKAIYTTVGVHIERNNFEYDFVLADSHNYSGAWRKHTILKGAISIKI